MCKFAPRGLPRLGFEYCFSSHSFYFKYLRNVLHNPSFFSSLELWYWSYMGGKMRWVFDWRSALYIFVCVCARLSYCGNGNFQPPWISFCVKATLFIMHWQQTSLIISQFLWNTFAAFTWFDWFATIRNTEHTWDRENSHLCHLLYIINISF